MIKKMLLASGLLASAFNAFSAEITKPTSLSFVGSIKGDVSYPYMSIPYVSITQSGNLTATIPLTPSQIEKLNSDTQVSVKAPFIDAVAFTFAEDTKWVPGSKIVNIKSTTRVFIFTLSRTVSANWTTGNFVLSVNSKLKISGHPEDSSFKDSSRFTPSTQTATISFTQNDDSILESQGSFYANGTHSFGTEIDLNGNTVQSESMGLKSGALVN